MRISDWSSDVCSSDLRKAAAAALLALAEQPFEDVADIARLAAEIELRAAGAESARARAATPAAEAEGGRGIAIGVDLAAVEARALVLVGEEIIGVGHLRKALGRLGVILVAIGVEFLRELAIRFLDVGLARPARHPQRRIWIGHLLLDRKS